MYLLSNAVPLIAQCGTGCPSAEQSQHSHSYGCTDSLSGWKDFFADVPRAVKNENATGNHCVFFFIEKLSIAASYLVASVTEEITHSEEHVFKYRYSSGFLKYGKKISQLCVCVQNKCCNAK